MQQVNCQRSLAIRILRKIETSKLYVFLHHGNLKGSFQTRKYLSLQFITTERERERDLNTRYQQTIISLFRVLRVQAEHNVLSSQSFRVADPGRDLPDPIIEKINQIFYFPLRPCKDLIVYLHPNITVTFMCTKYIKLYNFLQPLL